MEELEEQRRSKTKTENLLSNAQETIREKRKQIQEMEQRVSLLCVRVCVV